MFLHLIALTAMADPGAIEARATRTFASADQPSIIEGRRQAALEKTLEPMNFVMAALAREKLDGSLAACATYTSSLSGDTFAFACDNMPTVTTVLGGPSAPYTNDKGKTYGVVSSRVSESVFNVIFQADGGAQTTTFDFSGEILVVTKVVTSDLLEVPLSCSFNYR